MAATQPETTRPLQPDSPLVVYGFANPVTIPTEQGTYFATAVGGQVSSRPPGNPFVLFYLQYIWDTAGNPMEFPDPFMIRLNTAQAVTESVNFSFPPAPEPEVAPEPPATTAPVVANGPPSTAPAVHTEGTEVDPEDEDDFFTEDGDEDDSEEEDEEFVDEDEEEMSELPFD